MQIFLSNQVVSLTGSLGKGYGYAVRRNKNGFYGVRNSKGVVPPDGHLKFILTCAQLAQMRTHIVDIRLTADELREALDEAGRQDVRIANWEYNANTVEHLRVLWNLDKSLL